MPNANREIIESLQKMEFHSFGIGEGVELRAGLSPRGVHMDRDKTVAALELHEMGLVPYKICLRGIDYNSRLKSFLKGNWMYINGKGPLESWKIGLKTWNENTGEIRPLGEGTAPEKRVRVWQGQNPLSLIVHSDHMTASLRRYDISAIIRSTEHAPVVIGISQGLGIVSDKVGNQLHGAYRHGHTHAIAALAQECRH